MNIKIQGSTLVLFVILGALSAKAISEAKKDIINEDDSTVIINKRLFDKSRTNKLVVPSIISAASQTVGGIIGGVGGLISGVGNIVGGIVPAVGQSVSSVVSPLVVGINPGQSFVGGQPGVFAPGVQGGHLGAHASASAGVFLPENIGGQFVGHHHGSQGGSVGHVQGFQGHHTGGYVPEVSSVQIVRPQTVSSPAFVNSYNSGGHSSGGFNHGTSGFEVPSYVTGHNAGVQVQEISGFGGSHNSGFNSGGYDYVDYSGGIHGAGNFGGVSTAHGSSWSGASANHGDSVIFGKH